MSTSRSSRRAELLALVKAQSAAAEVPIMAVTEGHASSHSTSPKADSASRNCWTARWVAACWALPTNAVILFHMYRDTDSRRNCTRIRGRSSSGVPGESVVRSQYSSPHRSPFRGGKHETEPVLLVSLSCWPLSSWLPAEAARTRQRRNGRQPDGERGGGTRRLPSELRRLSRRRRRRRAELLQGRGHPRAETHRRGGVASMDKVIDMVPCPRGTAWR